jgi:hypothetical protein
MLEGYKPIDFGTQRFSPLDFASGGQARNKVGLSPVAQQILSNSQWKNVPINTLRSAGLSSRGEAPPHKQPVLNRIFDFLSVGNYTIANALDESIAGAQNQEGFIDSTRDAIGGLATGGARGFAASLRGAFGTHEAATDHSNKTRFGDVGLRLLTGMSTQDAMLPENWEDIKPGLKESQDKNWWNKSLPEMLIPGDLNTEGSQSQLYRNQMLGGLGHDILIDPLNLVPVTIPGRAAKGVTEATQLLKSSDDASKGLNKINQSIEDGFNLTTSISKPNAANLGWGKTPGVYNVELPAKAVQNQIATPEGLKQVPDWFQFPSSPQAMSTVAKPAESPINQIINDAISIPEMSKSFKEGIVTKPNKDILKVTESFSKSMYRNRFISSLLGYAAKGEKNWLTRANTLISNASNRQGFPATSKFLERMSEVPNFSQRLKIPSERNKIISALNRTIAKDIEDLKSGPGVKSAENIINEATSTGIAPVTLNPATKLSTSQQNLAQSTFNKFREQILGKGLPTGIKNPAAYRASVASGKTAKYSGSQQVQMWNYITHNLTFKAPQKFSAANKILRQVEDMFIAQNVKPLSGFKVSESVPLRLSHVLDAIGPAAAAMRPELLTKILRGEPKAIATLDASVVQKIEALKANEALTDAATVSQGISAGQEFFESMMKQGPLSVARTSDVATISSKVAEDITKSTGSSATGVSKAGEFLLNEVFPKNAIDSTIAANQINTTALISHPDVSGSLIKKYSSAPSVDRAIAKALESPSPRQLASKVGPSARVIDWLGARFNTAYKNPDLRPTYVREVVAAKSTIAKRATYLNQLAKQYPIRDADLWNDAMKAATGKIPPVAGSEAEKLSQEILSTMENLFGSSGLKAGAAAEHTVVGRSQLFMKELNEKLRQFGLGSYQFTKKGDEYKDGINWLNSWKDWDIKNPIEFLFRMQNVVEHTVREKIMFDDIVARFGSPTKTGPFKEAVKHPRLDGFYFTPEIAKQGNQFIKNLKEINKPSSKSAQHFDKVLSKWKAAVTIYVPSHHIRNMIGDTYFNWLAGVNSARPYGTAIKVMNSQRGRYTNLDEIGSLTSPQAVMKLMEGGSSVAKGNNIALTMRNGTKVTNDMVYVSAFQQGILPTTRVLEDIPENASFVDKVRPLGGKGQKVAHSVSEGQNHYVRLAHYIDHLKKSNKPFEAATKDAAALVRKWHPDGMDLTRFEKTVMRRIFPFYSWTRKSFPLIFESAILNHQKVLAYPRAQNAMQMVLGDVDPAQGISDPFPTDQLFPDWLREKGVGPMWGGQGDYTMFSPGNPTMDAFASFNDPGKGALGMLNPAAKIPIELTTGRETFSGAPLDGYFDENYWAKQVPGVSHLGRGSGLFGVSETTKEEGFPNWQNIINMLTAAGIVDTGKYQKSGEFDLREYLRSRQ